MLSRVSCVPGAARLGPVAELLQPTVALPSVMTVAPGSTWSETKVWSEAPYGPLFQSGQELLHEFVKFRSTGRPQVRFRTFSLHERRQILQGIQILRQHFAVTHHDPELLL